MKINLAEICKTLAIFGAVVAIAVWVWARFVPRQVLPADDEIDSIAIDAFVDLDAPRKLDFEVPPDHFRPILESLQPARFDPDPARWMLSGGMEITMRDGQLVYVILFATQQEIGAFKIGEKYYRGGNSDQFEQALKDAHAASTAADPQPLEKVP